MHFAIVGNKREFHLNCTCHNGAIEWVIVIVQFVADFYRLVVKGKRINGAVQKQVVYPFRKGFVDLDIFVLNEQRQFPKDWSRHENPSVTIGSGFFKSFFYFFAKAFSTVAKEVNKRMSICN